MAYRWGRGEGGGASERPVREHPWMAELIPSDADESASDDGSWEADDLGG